MLNKWAELKMSGVIILATIVHKCGATQFRRSGPLTCPGHPVVEREKGEGKGRIITRSLIIFLKELQVRHRSLME